MNTPMQAVVYHGKDDIEERRLADVVLNAAEMRVETLVEQVKFLSSERGADAVHCERLIQLIEAGKIDTTPLMTHTLLKDLY